MFRQAGWFAVGLLFAFGTIIGISYVGWLYFGKQAPPAVREPVVEPPTPEREPPPELAPMPRDKRSAPIQPSDEPEPEKPLFAVEPFTKSESGEPVLVAPKPELAPDLPPAAVPTLTPSQRLGDRKYRGPHVLTPLAINSDGSIAAFSTGMEVMTNRWLWHGQKLVVWDVANERELGRVEGEFAQIHLSPDGRLLFAGGSRDRFRGGQLRVWDVRTRKVLHERPAALFALSADGKILATVDLHVGTFDRMNRDEPDVPWRCTIATWSTTEFRLLSAHTYTSFIPSEIALSPDGKRVVCAAGDRIAAFDTTSGKRFWSGKLEADKYASGEQFWLLVSPDGKSVASVEHWYFPTRHLVRIWDMASGTSRLLSTDERVDGGNPPLVGMSFSPDSKTLFVSFRGAIAPVSVADGRIPRIIHHEDEEKRKEFFARGLQPPHMESMYTFVMTPDGNTALIAGRFKDNSCGLRVMDVATREVDYPPPLKRVVPPYSPADEFLGPNEPFHAVSHEWMKLPDGRELNWRSYSGVLRIGNRGEEGKQIGDGEILNYVVTPDGETIITRGKGKNLANGTYQDDQKLRFRDNNGKEWGAVDGPEWSQVWARRAIALSADGRTLATRNADGSIWLYEVATLKPRLRLDPAGNEDLYRFAFSRDGRYIMSNDFRAQSGLVWDLRTVVGEKNDAPDERDLASLWESLRGDDAAAAYGAIWRLASHPKQAIPFLKQKVKDVPAVTDQKRRAARPFDAELVLARRFVEVLENCGTPEAVALIKEIVVMPAFAVPAGAALQRAAAK